MENNNVFTLTRLFLLFLIFFFFSGISFAQPPPAPVSVSEVLEKEMKKPIKLVGATFPAKNSIISSEVAGIVKKLRAQEGEYVKKGDLLAEIKDDKIGLELKRLQNERERVLAEATLSEKDFKRAENLYEKGVISDGDFDSAKTKRDSNSAALLSLDSQIEIAEYNLDASKITAPYNGYVTKHHIDEGQWLDIGGQVVSFVDIDTIEVMAGLPERYIEDVREGMEVEVVISSLNRRSFPGKIFSIIPDAEPRTVSFPIKVLLENPDHVIKASTSAAIKIRIGESEKIKLVPKDSIVNSPNGPMVFAVRKGVAHPVPVIEKNWYEGLAQVEGQISAGESVVVRGNERLIPMQQVTIVDSVKP